MHAVVPAAGRSERMGRAKLTLPWRGTTVLGSLLRALRAGGVASTVVVIQDGDAVTAEEARRQGAGVVANPDPDRGMLSSVWCGLEALAALAHPWPAPVLICPGDLPAISAETIRRLVHLPAEPGSVVVPTWRGRRGHPLRLGEALVPEIADLDPAVGLREILDRRSDRVCRLAVSDPGVLRDVDTPADYAALRDLVSSGAG